MYCNHWMLLYFALDPWFLPLALWSLIIFKDGTVAGRGQRGRLAKTSASTLTHPAPASSFGKQRDILFWNIWLFLRVIRRKDSKKQGRGGEGKRERRRENEYFLWAVSLWTSSMFSSLLTIGVWALFLDNLPLFYLLKSHPSIITLYQIICLKMKPNLLVPRPSGKLQCTQRQACLWLSLLRKGESLLFPLGDASLPWQWCHFLGLFFLRF